MTQPTPHTAVNGNAKAPLVEYRASLPFDEFTKKYTSESVREACLACKNYGNNWSCPPFDDNGNAPLLQYCRSIEVVCYLMPLDGYTGSLSDEAAVERYKHDMLHATRTAMTDYLLEAERAHPGTIVLFPGSCSLCGVGNCAKARGVPCIHPWSMRPSLEAFGFDLGKVAKDLFDLEFCWAAEGELPAYYLLVGALLTM